MELYIGLMSGISADGINAALVDFNHDALRILATHYSPYSQKIREEIFALSKNGYGEIERMGQLDITLGKAFAQTAKCLLSKQSLCIDAICAIGSHGQTIRHSPQKSYGFTLQIGDPNTIAAETGITTVADFRRKDMALGGQGAPLVPSFHHYLFATEHMNRAIVNIGGIANVTLLPKKNAGNTRGFDIGPGNVLLDAWIKHHQNKSYDNKGSWATEGTVQNKLLDVLLEDPYFALEPPKSTGREYFNLDWLQSYLTQARLNPEDVQATLVELTAKSIIQAISHYFTQGEILICGGGVHNDFLMLRLSELAKPKFTLYSTQKYHVDPDWIEALAFAWLARQTLNRKPGNLPHVTGAKRETILGGIYYSD